MSIYWHLDAASLTQVNLKMLTHMRDFISLQATGNTEILKLHKMLEDETYQKGRLEEEIAMLRSQLLQLSLDADEV